MLGSKAQGIIIVIESQGLHMRYILTGKQDHDFNRKLMKNWVKGRVLNCMPVNDREWHICHPSHTDISCVLAFCMERKESSEYDVRS